MSLRFHLFVSDVNQANEVFEFKKVSSRFSCLDPRKFTNLWSLVIIFCGDLSRKEEV